VTAADSHTRSVAAARELKARELRMNCSPPRNGAVCQAPGCGAYVGHLRHFYRRSRICVAHHQATTISCGDGTCLRFCTWCCVLHDVSEFDGDSRSCREEQERRRKTVCCQPIKTRCSLLAPHDKSPACTGANAHFHAALRPCSLSAAGRALKGTRQQETSRLRSMLALCQPPGAAASKSWFSFTSRLRL
jgi:hypothetical protein